MAVKFILDTSAFSAFDRQDMRMRPWIVAKHEIVVPSVVVGELRAGFAAGNKRQINDALLERFLNAPNVNVVTISDKTTHLYADVFAAQRQAGKPINVNDMWIAALAFEHNLPLLTLDSDFTRVSGLELVQV